MRTPAFLLLVSLSIFVASGGIVVADPRKNDDRKNATQKQQDEYEKPPFVGMTKAQALARYGEPKQHTLTDKGEQWVYLLNYGEVIGKAFIPFNFKPTPIRTGVLTFGPNGKVKEFRWDAPTKD